MKKEITFDLYRSQSRKVIFVKFITAVHKNIIYFRDIYGII